MELGRYIIGHFGCLSDKGRKHGFHGVWLHFQRARVGGVFSVAMCKVHASKSCMWVLTISAKDERSCFFHGEMSAVWLPLNWHVYPLEVGHSPDFVNQFQGKFWVTLLHWVSTTSRRVTLWSSWWARRRQHQSQLQPQRWVSFVPLHTHKYTVQFAKHTFSVLSIVGGKCGCACV